MTRTHNALFLCFENLNEIGGITNKILYQKEALQNNGFKTFLSSIKKDQYGNSSFFIDDKKLISHKSNFLGKLKRLDLHFLYKWIKANEINLLYVRYNRGANPFFVKLFKDLKKLGVTIFLEIPTYPYDKELISKSRFDRIIISVEKTYRSKLAKYIDRIVTFSQDNFIWDVPTVKILNGVDINSIPLKKEIHTASITLIGVASILFWHGYDRVIEGLKLYYGTNPKTKVYFNVIGGNSGNENYLSLKHKVKELNLENYVKFFGELKGKQLDAVFDISDIGVGSLGRHRTGIYTFQALKNVEYAMRGIPFIYSENSPLFDNEAYIMHCIPDDSPIDIKGIVDFYNTLSMTPAEIRQNCQSKGVSWDEQFKKITTEYRILNQNHKRHSPSIL